jgi:hypothetical protein
MITLYVTSAAHELTLLTPAGLGVVAKSKTLPSWESNPDGSARSLATILTELFWLLQISAVKESKQTEREDRILSHFVPCRFRIT